ncbi:HesA/MoeB/ThiF family protein [Niabella aurantiaca]|uniref:HesA/MoeB/ThiF family protein n=1 Tax=Niabella aurantiaca TaxID=379900 RepID=UPI000368F132|nr:ThiF family adenylyltransferase [Niabella aurantiaca]
MSLTKNKPYIIFRIPQELRSEMEQDLRRPHSYACERVGFLFTKSKWIDQNKILIVAISYQCVADEHYIEDPTVGAKIGSEAIRSAMQTMFDMKSGCFHVHLHDHQGRPGPSATDKKGLPGVIESFANIAGGQPTGILILSKDNFFTAIKVTSNKRLYPASLVSVVGFPMRFCFNSSRTVIQDNVFKRQSFLGPSAQWLFENVRIGIVGYGGGGSHIGQQLAHIGVRHIAIFDGDHIEDSNLNRLIGGQRKDILKGLAKTSIARRTIKAILPTAKVTIINSRWQDAPDMLQQCDLIIGGIDTYAERQQLEAECRRYLIPYLDIGMDVYQSGEEPPTMSGQVMLSLPGKPCFWCYGFLSEEKLAKEAAKYGKVGGRPQVVWPNGVLASTAVGILVELITGWTQRKDAHIYLEYDGNIGQMKDHVRIRFCDKTCSHYPLQNTGPVRFKSV